LAAAVVTTLHPSIAGARLRGEAFDGR